MLKTREKRAGMSMVLLFVLAVFFSFAKPDFANAAVVINKNLPINIGYLTYGYANPDEIHNYNFFIGTSGKVTMTYRGTDKGDLSFSLYKEGIAKEIVSDYYSRYTKLDEIRTLTYDLEEGYYCIRIEGQGIYNFGAFGVQIDFAPSYATEVEPNNTFATAMALSSDMRVTAFLSYQDATDIFRIIVPSDQEVKISGETMAKYLDVTVYDDSLNKIQQINTGFASEEYPKTYEWKRTLPSGFYYIKVTKTEDAGTGRYTLKWTGEKEDDPVKPDTIKVEEITLSKNKRVAYGNGFTLKATVSPAKATNKTLKWTSSNKKVATVSSKGVIKTKKPGTAVIKAAATDGSGVYATTRVIVLPKKIAVTSLKKGKTNFKISWAKQNGVSGYEVEVATNKAFNDSITKEVAASQKAVTISNLSGKTYYVRVRGVVSHGENDYYGAWSKRKVVKLAGQTEKKEEETKE